MRKLKPSTNLEKNLELIHRLSTLFEQYSLQNILGLGGNVTLQFITT